jgi:hypothetical protein
MEMTKMTATDLTTQPQKSLAPRILRQVSLRGMMNANPAPPGSYYLGEADADGLVVVANPLTRIVLAVGAESCGLIALGHTAAATALGLPGNRMGLVVVTERPDHWPASVPGVQVFMPEQFGELVSPLDGLALRRFASTGDSRRHLGCVGTSRSGYPDADP